jgi:hypothetical protein
LRASGFHFRMLIFIGDFFMKMKTPLRRHVMYCLSQDIQ